MISIIVPVYNVENYIDACMNSIFSQTMADYELILVDDGSTDSSGNKCDEWCEKDGRIKVIHQKNQGLSQARNSGLEIASGDYIAFIDSDDCIEENYLQTLFDNAVSNEAEVSVCSYVFVWEDPGKNNVPSQIAYETEVLSGREACEKIIKENQRFMITAWGKLYHKSLTPLLFYPKGRTHEDEFVTYKVFYQAKKVAVTKAPLYRYLQRGSGIMGTDFKLKRLDKLVALHESVQYFETEKDEDMKRYALKRYLLNIQIAWYRVHKYLPKEKHVMSELRKEWKTQKQTNRKTLKGCFSLTDKITMLVFGVSPVLYGCIAGMYLKLVPQE